ncbi:hypothetical protein BTZ20_5372 [Rhodococcus sp. MTM3W5.2]|uniref:hypothetical protein n=1 Tax=Rhodococcus sp. MTM3W5.2 TaxID=1805827 RepID=UPI00097971F9|nr:hypothetical protein [Rhodococcus sp. MTM3W5.2]AQA24782.1 hypothetical protein BTZ20_5372 [Rhodococcus sp. MTM3W5.2]
MTSTELEPTKSTRAGRRVVTGAVVGALLAVGFVAVNRFRTRPPVSQALWDADPIGPDDLAG